VLLMQRIMMDAFSTFKPHVRDWNPGWEEMVLRISFQVWDEEP
jgi:hypothetical protein